MNAIALLKADHRAVEELFEKLAELNGRSAKTKKSIVEKLVRELSIHTAIEEQIFYPTVRREIPEENEIVLASLEEHNVMKWLLDGVQSMDVDDELFEAKVKVLRDVTLRHIDEEENVLFPKVREALDVARLNEMGNELEKAKKVAPTRPNPRAPDQQPANILMNMGAAGVDRGRGAGRAAVRSARGARGARGAQARTGAAKRASKAPAAKRARASGSTKQPTARARRSGSRAQAR